MEEQTFYMVYLQDGGAPTFKHTSYESASIEAKRLSKQYGKKSYVLATVMSFELMEFIERDMRPNELPF